MSIVNESPGEFVATWFKYFLFFSSLGLVLHNERIVHVVFFAELNIT